MQRSLGSHAPDEGLAAPDCYLALAAVLAGMVLVVLDGAIANVALPTIASALRVTADASVWIVTGYQLALVIAILPCAALGESIGLRPVFIFGALLFTAASALCALAPSLQWLVVARFLQGLGGAALMALGVALLRFAFPQRQLGAVIGWNSLTIALSAAVGPTLGATIISYASWPWLFAVNVPVGAIVLFASRSLPNPPGTGLRLDFFSAALNAMTFGALVLAAEYFSARPGLAFLLLIVAIASLLAMIAREMPRPAPLIPLDLLRDPSFRISVFASVFCFAGQMASYVALPFYLQHGLGQSPLMTGFLMTPWPLAVAVAGPVSGHYADRLSTAKLSAAGGFFLAIGLTLMSLWPLKDGLFTIVPLAIVCGTGFGIFQVSNNRNMFMSAPRARSGAAGGMQGTARLVGQTAGAVLMTVLLSHLSLDLAPRVGLGCAAALTLASALISMLRVGQRSQL